MTVHRLAALFTGALIAGAVVAGPAAAAPVATGPAAAARVPTPTTVPGTALRSLPGPGRPGATVPFAEYEAENARTNGQLLGPSYAYTGIAAEASGRRAVRLAGRGKYVEFTLAAAADALDVRYSIPDTADGTGAGARLSVLLDGRKVAQLALTSRYSHVYGTYPFSNRPADLGEHHYFDDARLRLPRLAPAGSTVRLQVDAASTAAWYVIDTADFERTGPPSRRPHGSLSVDDFGADPYGVVDSTQAVQRAIDAGRTAGTPVWIPAGTYRVTGHLAVDRVTLTGAGPWYSVLQGPNVGLYGNAAPNPSADVHLADFAVFGDTTGRNDTIPDSGIGGAMGDGSTVDNLWIEHMNVGIWLDGPFDGLTLRHLRIQNTWADGLNLHDGIGHVTVADTFVRNTGDDGMAMWSDRHADHDNVFVRNTVALPILANSYAIYGGTDNAVTDSIGADTVTQGGAFHVGNRFAAVPLAGTTRISRNLAVRAGSLVPDPPLQEAAIWFWAADAPMTGTVLVQRNVVLDSPHAAFQFFGKEITGVRLSGNRVDGAGTFAIQLQAPGRAEVDHLVATGVGVAGVYDCGSGFVLVRGPGNRGWPGTRCGFPPSGALTVTPRTLAFGNQDLGTSSSRELTVTNPGPVPIDILGVRVPAGYTATPSCATIPVGGSCTITVRFTPTTPGNYAGLLVLHSTSPVGPYFVDLSGVGYDPNGNLALAQPITASSATGAGYGAANANDGNPDTYWESAAGAFPQTLTVDLGQSRQVGRIALRLPAPWGARTETLSVLVSTDGANFTTAVPPAPYRLDPDTGNAVSVPFAGTTARYVRIQVSDNTGWSAAQFSEFEVYAH